MLLDHRNNRILSRDSQEQGTMAGPDPFGLITQLEWVCETWRGTTVERACALHHSAMTNLWNIQEFGAGNHKCISVNIKEIITHIAAHDSNVLVLCHYHPNGTTAPSNMDKCTTRSILQICRALQVELLDHIIFGSVPCFSFRRAGYL